VEKYDRARQATDDNIIRRMRLACWITKATDTPSEYVILIAFPRQEWLRENVSMLRHTYIACLVLYLKRILVVFLKKIQPDVTYLIRSKIIVIFCGGIHRLIQPLPIALPVPLLFTSSYIELALISLMR
jgi:hypothetical protein